MPWHEMPIDGRVDFSISLAECERIGIESSDGGAATVCCRRRGADAANSREVPHARSGGAATIRIGRHRTDMLPSGHRAQDSASIASIVASLSRHSALIQAWKRARASGLRS